MHLAHRSAHGGIREVKSVFVDVVVRLEERNHLRPSIDRSFTFPIHRLAPTFVVTLSRRKDTLKILFNANSNKVVALHYNDERDEEPPPAQSNPKTFA
jgi:hypothetical protein